MDKRHLRLVPSEPDTGLEEIDSVIKAVAEALRFADDRLFLGQIDQVTAPDGRYFEATLDEVAGWVGADTLRHHEGLSELSHFEQYGWGLFIWLPDGGVCRIVTSPST